MTEDSRTAEVVVVGLGLIGSGALRHLAVDGVDVVGVGPVEPEVFATHDGVFASHYDSGRITRKLDRRFEWAELARRSIAEYPTIARDGGVEFHVPAGTVFSSRDDAHIAALDEVGKRVGADHRILGSAATGLATTSDGRVLVAEGRLALPAGSTAIAEPGPAGFIDPRRMLQAQLHAAEHHGATVIRSEVVSVSPAADGTAGWTVTAADGSVVTAPRVLLATGAHTDELGPAHGRFESRVRPEVVVMATLGEDEQQRLAGLPSVLAHLYRTSFADLYQVPPTIYPDGTVRLKLGATKREWEPLATGEQRRAWMQSEDHTTWLDELRSLMEDLVPNLQAEAWATKPCMITDTESGLPTIDHLADGLVVAAGGNGYAAKSADAIGALAAALLAGGDWPDRALDAKPFAETPRREGRGVSEVVSSWVPAGPAVVRPCGAGRGAAGRRRARG